MLKGIGLQELARKIEMARNDKRDYVADTRQVEMGINGDGKPILQIPNAPRALDILPLAHNQIGDRLKIPNKYYDKMLAEDPGLLATNVNTWFQKNPERRMFRTIGSNDRAVLSNRFQRIEHEHIAEAALTVLADLPSVQITSAEVTDRRLYIHFTVPTIQGEVKVGDIVQAGGIIQNSEVGLGSASVAGLIWRLWCLNGAKTADTFRKNHVGRQVDEGELEWADDTMQADDKAILLKIRDMTKAIVDEGRFKAQLTKLQGLTEGKITGNPVAAVEVLAAKVNANETEKSSMLRKLIEGGDLSAWGMVNAVTSLAHDATSYDRAVEIESMGGTLIDLPATQWREVLQAEAA